MDTDTIQAVAALGAAAAAKTFDANGRTYALIPSGYETEELLPHEPMLPSFITQSVRLDTEASFISYVTEFAEPATRLFYNKDTTTVIAVFDYHTPGKDNAAVYGRRAHQARLPLRHSAAWKAWTNINGAKIPQSQFAEFLEEHLTDIREPDGATILEIATNLQINRSVSFVSAKNLGNGTVNFTYKEDDKATGNNTLAVPTDIKLGLLVFDGDTAGWEVKAKFRYDLDRNTGKLSFIVKLLDLDSILEKATAEIAARIAEATKIEVLRGSL